MSSSCLGVPAYLPKEDEGCASSSFLVAVLDTA
jgi:hypothetical protein